MNMKRLNVPFLAAVAAAAILLAIPLSAIGTEFYPDDPNDRYNPNDPYDPNDPNEREEPQQIEEPKKPSEPQISPPPPLPAEPSTCACDIIGKTATAFPYTVARSIRDVIALGVPGRRWEFSVAYEDIKYREVSGDSWLFTSGYERTFSPWGCGVLVPVQRWSLNGFDEFWQIGVVPYVFMVIKDVARIGVFVEADQSMSDIEELDDETSWAAGAFASVPFSLGDKVTITPVGIYEHYWTGQESFSDSDLFTLGPKVDVALSDKVLVALFGFYTIETENDEIDDSYWEYGLMLTYLFKETWGVTFGYQGIDGAEDLDYDKFFIGAHLNF